MLLTFIIALGVLGALALVLSAMQRAVARRRRSSAASR